MRIQMFYSALKGDTQRDLPNTDKKSKFLYESKSQESESGSSIEREREGMRK